MRHQKAGKKLGRTGSHRNAMFRNMVTSLFEHGRIRTTDIKAKELRRWADRMVSLAKRGDLHARRQALAVIRDKGVVHKLFEEASKRFGERAGGYTNLVKIGRRRGDAASMSLVELVNPREEKERKKKEGKLKKKADVKAEKEARAEDREKKEPEKVEIADQGTSRPVAGAEKRDVAEPDSAAQVQEAGVGSPRKVSEEDHDKT